MTASWDPIVYIMLQSHGVINSSIIAVSKLNEPTSVKGVTAIQSFAKLREEFY